MGLVGSIRSNYLPSGLVHLDLSYNRISGAISSFPVGLTFLNLNSNDLTSISASYPSGLQHLDLGNNPSLTSIPSTPTTVTHLSVNNVGYYFGVSIFEFAQNRVYIDFSDNSLTGAIPLLPPGLQYFNMSANRLSGPIPTLPQNLTVFDVHRNGLTGKIPVPLPSTLIQLAVDGNRLIGDVPTLPLNLQYLWLGGNKFTGSVTINRPIKLFINSNNITDVYVTDTSVLTIGNCDLSDNPLLGNANIANLIMCTRTGLFDAVSIPATIRGSSSKVTTILLNTLTTTTPSVGATALIHMDLFTSFHPYPYLTNGRLKVNSTSFATVKQNNCNR